MIRIPGEQHDGGGDHGDDERHDHLSRGNPSTQPTAHDIAVDGSLQGTDARAELGVRAGQFVLGAIPEPAAEECGEQPPRQTGDPVGGDQLQREGVLGPGLLVLDDADPSVHGEIDQLRRDCAAAAADDVGAPQQVVAIRRQVLGNDCRPAVGIAGDGRADGEAPDRRADSSQQGDQLHPADGVGEVAAVARHEGARFECDRDGDVLEGCQAGIRCRDDPASFPDLALLGGTFRSGVAGQLSGEPVSDRRIHVDSRGDRPERLCPVGAVGVPVELVDAGVLEEPGDVLLLVGDDVGLRAVHVVVRGDGD